MDNKGALSLIRQYGEESSDEEVPGPRVSTKRVYRDDSDEEPTQKRLPLPAEFLKNTKTDDYIDDPSLHEGRLRNFGHERGNWATFIYIPFEAQAGISELITYIKLIIPDHYALKCSDDFHISLTKTVVLKYHWISSFVESVKLTLSGFKKFFILFDKVKVYCNEERTRTFIGIQIRSGHDTLLKMVESFDKCLAEFNLSPFYKDKSFHISVAWAVGDNQEIFESFIPEINSKLSQLMETYSQDNWYILADSIVCKTGNKFFRFGLD